MRRSVWFGISLGVLLGVGVLLVVGASALMRQFQPTPVEQPIAFNHKLHLAEDISCKDCHKRVEKGRHATFPSIKVCLLCHEEAQGENPEEPKVREYAKEGRSIPWKQVNRLPGHVYFSHVAHVKYAEMDCNACHGDMKQRTKPISRSQFPPSGVIRTLLGKAQVMDQCIACHKERGVSTDCLRCHK